MKKILFALLIVASHATMLAQKPKIVTSNKDGWHKIGETTVNFKTETDEILVWGADRFEAIKIKVTEAPIFLVSFDIYFENGNKQSVAIGSQDIESSGETRTIQLDGGERSVKKVVFVYKTVDNNKDKKARVELWGLKTNQDKK